MYKLPLTLTLVLLACAGMALAAESTDGVVTFNKDVLPILQEECQSCHRPSGANMSGMIAPMPLMTYAETRPWAKSIARSAVALDMPPWSANHEQHGLFSNERTLTEDEIGVLQRWARTGALRGDPADAPAPIQWPETGWTIGGGNPDLVVSFDEPNWVADEVDDLYQNITIQLSEEDHPRDRWMKAIEFKPGSEVVHHIIAYAVGPTGSGAMTSGMLGGEAPGTDPATFPDGYGIMVPKGARVTFQMHYHKEAGPGTGVFDKSVMAMEFHDQPVTNPLRVDTIGHGAFEIPPGHPWWKVGAARVFKEDTTILSYLPHLHLRGKAARYTAYYPDGTSEILLDVPRYDFNWQISYEYRQPRTIPAGTRVEFEMWYDNSAENAEGIGFDSGRAVSFGGPTWDEMDLGFMTHTPAAPRVIEVPSAAGR